MSAEVLIDTNVLVYAIDADEPVKQRASETVLDALMSRDAAAVSTQVLGEFYVTAVRCFPGSVDRRAASDEVQRLAQVFRVYDTGLAVVLEALRGVVRYGFSYYDAQIWACARLNHIPVVLSEDFRDGSEIEGVRFANPFAPGFDVEALLAS